ncbi:LysR family transcriptional regulator [Pseudomonas argentinensis]|uniref:Transcriptional regulator, LysR family n=1 Tax=Phytopseudomonas argentinensis TaxID=289370 RepID=A0A1I3N7U5_9GAMM|nr:LysR family transcriptional regulator [Pseudomonas argentinensis]KAB0550120.1 LysR family transcriptional regulator [Pseudomonas argentinensis]SFJ05317.1 transcriptional regulator, LysR family [Pseudomonas argentinensis]
MDLRDLSYFEVIAELGHLGQAAAKLNRSQPALTKSIQRLEDSLGIRLFEKDGRGIKLSEAGRLMMIRSKQLQLSISETKREVRDLANGLIGTVRLGCSASMAEHLLPELATSLLEQAPEVRLSLTIGQDDLLKDSLRSGQLDAIICPLHADDPQLTTYPILQDEAVVVASNEHPIFSAPYGVKDLARYRWILPAPSVSSRRWIDDVFAVHRLPAPVVQIETNSISMLPRLIARTNFLSFLAKESLQSHRDMNLLREVVLGETTMTRTVAVTIRKERYLPSAAAALVEMLREDARKFLGKRPL